MRVIERSQIVYGARLMGEGFGGNALSSLLIERVQSAFYNPRGRDGIAEGSILVSTLGDGLSSLDLNSCQSGK